MRRTQQLAVGHAGQGNVVGKTGLAGYFCAGVHATAWNTDHAQVFVVCSRIVSGLLW
jgi:hypothetical protein